MREHKSFRERESLHKMGILLLLKKFTLLFLVLSSSFLSTSFAGRRITILVNKYSNEEIDQEAYEEIPYDHHREEAANIHERLLRVTTKDYGSYDPTPALVKPPFKLIPN